VRFQETCHELPTYSEFRVLGLNRHVEQFVGRPRLSLGLDTSVFSENRRQNRVEGY
jgi:hypothetical protein